MILIDGSQGEGGGQILRSSLSLAMLTGQPFRLENIRAGRPKPGLQAQHLASVNAAAAICSAELTGASLGSTTLSFQPGPVAPGDYSFAVGTAGSATLVLQTVLPALITAAGPSTLLLEGGTHNPWAPPFEFLANSFLPLLAQMGPKVRAKLDRHGFYPAGGGKIRVTIEPVARLAPLQLHERGEPVSRRATALLANLAEHIAERELKVLRRELKLEPCELHTEIAKAPAMANLAMVEFAFATVTEVFISFGERGLPAEEVARRLAQEARRYLGAEVPVGEHLADQLLLPLALAGAGSFITLPPTAHTRTNIEVIQTFLPVLFEVEEIRAQAFRITVRAA